MLVLEGTKHYVEGALRLLQFVEGRRATGRRFGADADARWNSFRGDLVTTDRIELMIRDADAEWRGGFGARTIYHLQGVPEDEPFGSQWESLDPVVAEEVWRHVKTLPVPSSASDVLHAIATAWGMTLSSHEVGEVSSTDHLVVVGASAIAATIEAFAAGAALDWSEQVVVVATAPGVRQLAAAGAAILNAAKTAPIIHSSDLNPKVVSVARLVASADAHPADLELAQKLIAG